MVNCPLIGHTALCSIPVPMASIAAKKKSLYHKIHKTKLRGNKCILPFLFDFQGLTIEEIS